MKTYITDEFLLHSPTADEVWSRANDRLSDHARIRKDASLATKVFPTFRPDKALAADKPDLFGPRVERLEQASGQPCRSLQEFLDALESRHAYFHGQGCRLSDHGLNHCFGPACTADEAGKIFGRARAGDAATAAEQDAFTGFLMVFFGRLDARRGWVKQLHLGAQRSNNSRLFRALGPDAGFDLIGDWPQAGSLARYLDALDSTNELPKTIVYNLNPADNYAMGTMIGNF